MQTMNDTEFDRLSIAVIDDHSLILEGFRSLLRAKGVGRVETFGSATEFLSGMPGRVFDIYIVDVEMQDMDGCELISRIRRHLPGARIIVSTIHDEPWTVHKLAALGVDAIVPKSRDMEELVRAISLVSRGGRYFSEGVEAAAGKAGAEAPSAREMEVLAEIAGGSSSKEIARRLCISENTVEAHRKKLYRKLKVRNVVDLIAKALRRGYIK